MEWGRTSHWRIRRANDIYLLAGLAMAHNEPFERKHKISKKSKKELRRDGAGLLRMYQMRAGVPRWTRVEQKYYATIF